MIRKFFSAFICLLWLSCDALCALTPEPHVMVIFGAGGDLAQHKLFPALSQLADDGLLPGGFAIVAVGRNDWSDEDFRRKIPKQLANRVFYLKLDFEQDAGYARLKELLDRIDRTHGTRGNRIFYLSTPPKAFPVVIERLASHHLIDQLPDKWSRVVIEKPFGTDLPSAIELQQKVSRYLEESQIYRIDHYLGKAIVQQVIPFRFDRGLLKDVWNSEHIGRVDITISEKQGIGTRGYFWEQTGLLRDMIQNHVMQMLAMVAMEEPLSRSAEDIRARKIEVLNAICPDMHARRGQYGSGIIDGVPVVGYRQEANVDPFSNVETLTSIALYIDNPRWQGVPFYLRGGKRLASSYAEVTVTFKDRPRLVFRIQPDPQIFFEGQSPLYMARGVPDAYEVLLHKCMLGDRSLFVGIEELLASWRLFTPILNKWHNQRAEDFPNYPAGSPADILDVEVPSFSVERPVPKSPACSSVEQSVPGR